MKYIDKLNTFLSGISGAVSAVMVLSMMTLIAIDVVLRGFFSSSFLGAYELVQLLLSIFVFFSFPYSQYHNRLIRVSFIVERFPVRGHAIAWAIGGLISTIVCIVLAYALYVQAGTPANLIVKTDVLRILKYPFYYIASIAMFIFAFTLAVDFVKSVVAIFKPEYHKEIARKHEKGAMDSR